MRHIYFIYYCHDRVWDNINLFNLKPFFLQEQMVVAAKSTKRKKHRKNSPKRMWALRMKFLAQCKKYIGTPYKRKYHEPGSELILAYIYFLC